MITVNDEKKMLFSKETTPSKNIHVLKLTITRYLGGRQDFSFHDIFI